MNEKLKEKVEDITMTDYGEITNEDYPRDSMIQDLINEIDHLEEEKEDLIQENWELRND